MIQDPILREVFVQWPAWQTVVERMMPVGTEARDVRPADVADELGAMDGPTLRRLAHLLVANGHVDHVDDAIPLLGELWALALVGKRPRYGTEAGVSSTAFEERS